MSLEMHFPAHFYVYFLFRMHSLSALTCLRFPMFHEHLPTALNKAVNTS